MIGELTDEVKVSTGSAYSEGGFGLQANLSEVRTTLFLRGALCFVLEGLLSLADRFHLIITKLYTKFGGSVDQIFT